MALAALPSLPSLSSFTQGAAQTTTDTLGNIFDAAGQHIGVVPGSIADVGTVGNPNAKTSQSSSGVPKTNASPTRASDYLKALEEWAANLVSRSDEPDTSGVTLEDIVFILLGVLLIAAALFSFRTTQTFVKEFSKSAAKAAMETAA